MKPHKSSCLLTCIFSLLLLAGQAKSFLCGLRNGSRATGHRRIKRVIGGGEAVSNSWPWMVNFIDKDLRQQCAGSIIDREWILSAAHCFLFEEAPFPLANYTYHVADHRLNFSDNYEYTIQPSQVFFHPKYFIGDNDQPGDYDIALIKLAKPLNYSDQVRAVCLPEENTAFLENDTCYLTGWGNTIDNSSYHRSPVLKEARLDLVPLQECNSNTSYNNTIPNRFLCAGFKKGGTDGCYGDSGGPLQCERNGTWTQIGIMLWGIGCAQPNHYGVYTDVKAFLTFINVIKDGPNVNLTAYYMKTLMEAMPNITERNSSNLYKLFTKESTFSDIDLVRNLQLVPEQIKLLKKTRLKDLVFVSNKNNLLANETTLKNITWLFLEQERRLNIYDKTKELGQQLNLTFEELLQLSNMTKDDLLNAKTAVIDKIKKKFYINGHFRKLEEYKKTLLMYNTNLTIVISMSKIENHFNALSFDSLKRLSQNSLKLILVKENREVFTQDITVRNISSFFEIRLDQLKNKTVIEVLIDVLNISRGDYALLHQLTSQQLDLVESVKISNISYSSDRSLFGITNAILKLKAQSYKCGIRNKNTNTHARRKRVIGGGEAVSNSWPWMVNFIDKDLRQQCAGSIIDREWILSAAHCFLFEEAPFPLANYSYHVADHRLNFSDNYEYTIQPSQVFFHPKYFIGDNDQPGDYDIALIKLAKPLNYSDQVRAVCLPEENTAFLENDTCYLTGWGNTIDNSSYHRSPVLKEARLDLVPFQECNSNTSYNNTIPNRFLCAGFKKGGTDGCNGDSGGPLQCERKGTWTQIGIMIWGIGCAQPNHYGVYTDVKAFLTFINVIKDGPNVNLTAYYMKTLMEAIPNITERNSSNLYKLFTTESTFSDIDLVRNLQLVPEQIKLLKKTKLKDLVFVSNKNNLLGNETTLKNITWVFLEQERRLNIYDKTKELGQQLNLTFEEILQLSNMTKDDLLNAKTAVIDKITKKFYINGHFRKLQEYKKTLLMYNTNLTIVISMSKIENHFNALSFDALKRLSQNSLKLILVKENREVFTQDITVRNISSFFEIGLDQLKNKTVIEVLIDVLNISRGDYALLHQLTSQQLDLVESVKISNISYSSDRSLFGITNAILKLKVQSYKCGIRNKNKNTHARRKRVIGGGGEAVSNSWPWMVNFIDKDLRQQCAGSIIDREWILSAAHCFLFEEAPFPLANYSYHVADHRLNFSDNYEYTIQPSQVFFHPKYIIGDNDQPGDYDIALIKLAKPLNYSDQVRAVCLPEENTAFLENDTCYLTGWGNTIDNSSYHRSPVLKEARLDLVPLQECNSNTSYNNTIPNRFLCAGFKKGGTDGCNGDSGGPLQCERKGTWTQIGIMIWGIGCAQPNHYGVYTDVKAFLTFINAIKDGPNVNLTAYYTKTLMEAIPNITERNSSNLYKLFTKESTFSDIDLVRNLQLVPEQIKLLKKTKLKDLVFVSNKNNLLANETTLKNITWVFLEQERRLNIYDKTKELGQQLNLTFEEILQLSNMTKDDLLNAKTAVIDKIKKKFYINGHFRKLQEYKKTLLMYNTNLTIVISMSKIENHFNALSFDALKRLSQNSLKLILVKENREVFTQDITVRNISSFFEIGLDQLKNKTVIEVLIDVLNISRGDYALLHQLTSQQLDLVESVKISNISYSSDRSLFGITNAILKLKEIDECSEKKKRCSTNAICTNLVGSFSCRCHKGYIGNGFNCVTGNTIYSSELRINQSFSPSLNNPTSYEFTNLVEKIENGISKGVKASKEFSGFIGTQVTQFKKGSVIAEFVLIFELDGNEKVNASHLTYVLTRTIRNDLSVSAVLSSPLQLSDLCKLGSHNCHKSADCKLVNKQVSCKCRENFYGDGRVKCEDPCQKMLCSSNSYCYRGLNGSAKCICDHDYTEDEDGKCEKNKEFKIPLIIVSCVAGLLFLVLLIILFCKYSSTRHKHSFDINGHEAGRSNVGVDDDIGLHKL